MVKRDLELSFANFHNEVIPQLSVERLKKLERLKRDIVEGSYQINSKKLADKLVRLIILSGSAAPGSAIQSMTLN
jgi:hypothetical protein